MKLVLLELLILLLIPPECLPEFPFISRCTLSTKLPIITTTTGVLRIRHTLNTPTLIHSSTESLIPKIISVILSSPPLRVVNTPSMVLNSTLRRITSNSELRLTMESRHVRFHNSLPTSSSKRLERITMPSLLQI